MFCEFNSVLLRMIWTKGLSGLISVLMNWFVRANVILVMGKET